MASRNERARIAKESLEIIDRGEYAGRHGRVALSESIARARDGSILYSPGDLERLPMPSPDHGATRRVQFEVCNETTLAAASRLTRELAVGRVAALNFASAKNPGGGFLNGSQAQEESLARASALYPCLMARHEMYDVNRSHGSSLYTDHMIYSPDVPVFRDDRDQLLDEFYEVSFITAPAVNAGAIRKNEPENAARIEPVMRHRIRNVLQVSLQHGHDVLILGAWGCGVFQNSTTNVAQWFYEQLGPGGPFEFVFSRVVFAVLDRSESHDFIAPFERRFLPAGG